MRRFLRSMDVDNKARATMSRRNSWESCPESLMNAATSHADSRIRVFSTVTVVMERPRTGGVAINCSQIFSSKFSTSATPMLGSAGSADRVASAEGEFVRAVAAGTCWFPDGGGAEGAAGRGAGSIPSGVLLLGDE